MAISQIRGEQIKLSTLREYHFDPITQLPESILDIDYAAHTETLVNKKILYKVQVNDKTADAVSSIDITSFVSGSAVTSSDSLEGVISDAPNNKVFIRDGLTQDSPLSDASGNQVFGRITYAGSTYTLSFYTDVNGTETAYTMPADQTIDFVYLKRGNLLNVPENFLVTDGGNFVEGATDIVAEFDLNQLAKDLGITLNKDGNKSVTRSAFEEILFQTKGLVNQSVRANSIIDEVVAARNGQSSLSDELSAIRTSVSTEAQNRADADTTIRNDFGSNDSGKGASLIGINDAGSKFNATTVEGALVELESRIVSTGSGATATTDEVVAARNSDITGNHANLDTRIEAGEARYEAVRSEVNTARNGKANLNAELVAIRQSVSDLADLEAQDVLDLQAAIDAEETRATLAEAQITSDLQQEVSDRQAAITGVQNDLTTEANTRAANDLTLQNNITAEATARANADTQIRNDLSSTTASDGGAKRVGVSSNAGLTGTTVESVLVNLEGRLASQESGGGAEVTDTHTRDQATANNMYGIDTFASLEERIVDIEDKTDAAKKALEDSIASEASTRASAVTTVTNSLNAEISRAQGAESDLQDAIDAEATTRAAETAQLTTDLAQEVQDRTSGDTAIRSDFASTATGKGASLVGVIDSASVFTGATVESVLKELYDAIQAQGTAYQSADTALSTRVSSLEAVRPKIHVHDRYVFTAVGNEQTVTLPNSKVADANTLIFTLNGVEQAVGLHYTEVLDGNGNATGVSINPDRLTAGDIVILKWLNANQ